MKTYLLFDNYGGADFDEVKAEMIAEIKDNEGEYKERCECCNAFIGVSDEAVWQRIADDEEIWWQDAMSEVKGYLSGRHFLAIGSVGLWNGRSKGGTVSNDFKVFLQRAGKDCDYFKIFIENGILKVQCTHHDGTNFWEIKPLTQRGLSTYEDWNHFNRFNGLSEEQIHEKLFNSKYYSQKLKVV